MRLATLFHLAVDLPWSILVAPIAALSRKVVPKDEVVEHAELVIAEHEIDRDKLVARLGQCGYVRSPLVEDQGTFAVRGSLLDVWTPTAELPVRIEFYGDLVMSLKALRARRAADGARSARGVDLAGARGGDDAGVRGEGAGARAGRVRRGGLALLQGARSSTTSPRGAPSSGPRASAGVRDPRLAR